MKIRTTNMRAESPSQPMMSRLINRDSSILCHSIFDSRKDNLIQDNGQEESNQRERFQNVGKSIFFLIV